MDKKHRGIITLEQKVILELVKFEGGEILRVSLDDYGRIRLLIEHPDMPEILEHERTPEVIPLYVRHQEAGRTWITREEELHY